MMEDNEAVPRRSRRYLPGSPFNSPAPARPAGTFAVHDQVTHDRYGLGVVLVVDGYDGSGMQKH